MAGARELSQKETITKFICYSIAMIAVPLAVFAWMHVIGVDCAHPCPPFPSANRSPFICQHPCQRPVLH
jgi:hypothetical protein